MSEISKKFTLVLEDKTYLKLTGVEGVVKLTETEACILICGEMLEIKGLNLKAEKLSVECGELFISGIITNLDFKEKREKKGFLKRILK